MERLGTAVLDRPAVLGLGASAGAHEVLVIEPGGLDPLASAEAHAFLANNVPPAVNGDVAAFNSFVEEEGDQAFQSYLE